MKAQTTIEWTEAKHISQHVTKEQTEYQKEKLLEFAESNYDMFTIDDFEFYVQATGLNEVVLMNICQSITTQRALKHQELTREMLKVKDYGHDLKYNPFKNQFMSWHSNNKWYTASSYTLEKHIAEVRNGH